MPRHDWMCKACGHTEKDMVHRLAQWPPRAECERGQLMEADFSNCLTKADVWEPFYCEAFDCDVNTRAEWQAILKDKGLIEAGDKVGGARNEETSSFAETMGKQAPKGIQYEWESEKKLKEVQLPEPELYDDDGNVLETEPLFK